MNKTKRHRKEKDGKDCLHCPRRFVHSSWRLLSLSFSSLIAKHIELRRDSIVKMGPHKHHCGVLDALRLSTMLIHSSTHNTPLILRIPLATRPLNLYIEDKINVIRSLAANILLPKRANKNRLKGRTSTNLWTDTSVI